MADSFAEARAIAAALNNNRRSYDMVSPTTVSPETIANTRRQILEEEAMRKAALDSAAEEELARRRANRQSYALPELMTAYEEQARRDAMMMQLMDTNPLFRDSIKKYNALRPVEPTPEPSIEDLAMQVIRGKLGSGMDRRRILGDKYAAVQAEVNRILAADAARRAARENNSRRVKGTSNVYTEW